MGRACVRAARAGRVEWHEVERTPLHYFIIYIYNIPTIHNMLYILCEGWVGGWGGTPLHYYIIYIYIL